MSASRPLSRRQVLQTASLLGVSALALSASDETAGAAPIAFTSNSGLVTGQMKPMKYQELPGLLTKAQVTPHYQAHYGGALKRYLAIEQQHDGLYQGQAALGGDAFTFMHKDKVNRMNSVLLHELYFD